MDKIIVVGIGEVLWDILPNGIRVGGAPANFAYHTSQFGLESHVVSAIGEDVWGNVLFRSMEEKNLVSYLEKIPYETGSIQVYLDENGVPYYDIMENVAWDNIPFTPKVEELAQKTSVVCFGSLAQRNIVSRETINRFLDAMPNGENVYKIFDANLRQFHYSRPVLTQSLKKCNVLKINEEELKIISKAYGCKDVDFENECWNLIRKFNLKMLILTCGSEGSYVFTSDNHHSYIRTPRVKVEDTVGAGDSFTAAFISGILQGKSLSKAHRLAVKVSAYVCTQKGAMVELPKELTE